MRTRTNKRWTQREIEYIREKYPTTKRRVLALEMGVSEVILESTIRRYGLRKLPARKMKRWTTRDIEYLRRNYPKYSTRVLALQMDLPQGNIEWAIRYNQIKKKPVKL